MTGERIFRRKNLGDASASPVCYFWILLLVLLFLLCLFLGCHGSILPSIFHGLLCNDAQLQLIECIESIKSDVKKKMMLSRAYDPCTKVTRDDFRRNFHQRNRHHQRFFRRKLFDASDFQLLSRQANASAVSRDVRSPFANFSLFLTARIYN